MNKESTSEVVHKPISSSATSTGNLPSDLPPISFLREQANVWDRETGGILKGIISTDAGQNASMIHSLFIMAPHLDGYRYRIVSVMHNIVPFYPVDIVYDASSNYEYEFVRPNRHSLDLIMEHQANNGEQLKQKLQAIFTSEEVRNIVASLVAQSEMPVAA